MIWCSAVVIKMPCCVDFNNIYCYIWFLSFVCSGDRKYIISLYITSAKQQSYSNIKQVFISLLFKAIEENVLYLVLWSGILASQGDLLIQQHCNSPQSGVGFRSKVSRLAKVCVLLRSSITHIVHGIWQLFDSACTHSGSEAGRHRRFPLPWW